VVNRLARFPTRKVTRNPVHSLLDPRATAVWFTPDMRHLPEKIHELTLSAHTYRTVSQRWGTRNSPDTDKSKRAKATWLP
jgi:hypothetical protein